MPYRTLDPDKIIATLEKLHERIEKRFPDSGLGRVCAEVLEVARHTSMRASALTAPSWPLRIGVGVILAAGLAAQIAAAKYLHIERIETDIGLLQSLEAAVNLLILFGGAAWFLITTEERLKRQRALDELHTLRSLAHVVDMHQLTKDPTLILEAHRKGIDGPPRAMSQFELARYLDYCAELLALLGKLAALYADKMRDSMVISAVTEIEDLTANLARKIWQKIMIIGALDERADEKRPSASPAQG
jgi:hypothetical protein